VKKNQRPIDKISMSHSTDRFDALGSLFQQMVILDQILFHLPYQLICITTVERICDG
jgi:hypothetical protein